MSDTELVYRAVLVYQQYTGTEDLPIADAIQRLASDLRLLATEYGCAIESFTQ